MAGLSKHLELIGTATEVGGTLLAGRQARLAGNYTARLLEQQAMAARASSSRAAAEEHRAKRYAQSRARAVAAASGGGPVPELIADIEAEGEYRALSALYEGEEAATGLQTQAAGERFSGARQAQMSRLSALGTALEAGPSLYDKYADDLPDWMKR